MNNLISGVLVNCVLFGFFIRKTLERHNTIIHLGFSLKLFLFIWWLLHCKVNINLIKIRIGFIDLLCNHYLNNFDTMCERFKRF